MVQRVIWRPSDFSGRTQMNEFMKVTDPSNSLAVSRRGFIAASASAALVAGATRPSQATLENQVAPVALSSDTDPYALAARFRKFLRVTDVVDGLDAVGRADLTLLDPNIRPLWMGMKFWGPAVTLRVVPTNRRMPTLERKDALEQHAIWNRLGGMHAELTVKPGCVVVTSTNGARECGYWGSNNSLSMEGKARWGSSPMAMPVTPMRSSCKGIRWPAAGLAGRSFRAESS